jgi:hypothetical protein
LSAALLLALLTRTATLLLSLLGLALLSLLALTLLPLSLLTLTLTWRAIHTLRHFFPSFFLVIFKVGI